MLWDAALRNEQKKNEEENTARRQANEIYQIKKIRMMATNSEYRFGAEAEKLSPEQKINRIKLFAFRRWRWNLEVEEKEAYLIRMNLKKSIFDYIIYF